MRGRGAEVPGPAAASRCGVGPLVVVAAVAALGVAPSTASAQEAGPVLRLPSRPPEAIGGAAFASTVRELEPEERERRIVEEVLRGNVPEWNRRLVPVEFARMLDGAERSVTVWVTPDYLAVGSSSDWFLTPLTPDAALRIAERAGTLLPTPPVVDAVWRAASVKLEPAPIPPSDAMTTVPVFEDHMRSVGAQRAAAGAPPGTLVAGHKKDVVLTARLDTLEGRVAIYGWHRPDGSPIQPLYTGHLDTWADYSHGIRLMHGTALVDGEPRTVVEILTDPTSAPLLSDDGPIRSLPLLLARAARSTVPGPRGGG